MCTATHVLALWKWKTVYSLKLCIFCLQMKDMTCRDVVKEVAKIIYIVHDEVKDKAFELELSWVGEITNGKHEIVPKDIREEAEKYAKESLKEEDESDDDNM
uniref:Proteasome 20S subunit alpha 3 n=1 Tax=Calidris pygmaea TaxID=425635 RepID=A0A8C3PI25_9CHAR